MTAGLQRYSPSSRLVWSLRGSGGTNISGFVPGTPPTLTATGNSTRSGAFSADQASPSTPTFPGSAWANNPPSPLTGLGPAQPSPSSYETPNTPVDLLDCTDVALVVSAPNAPTGGSPSLLVAIDVFDEWGGVYPQVIKMSAAMTAAGKTWVSGGLHSSGLVLPRWAQVTWTLDGSSSWAGVDIAVYGR